MILKGPEHYYISLDKEKEELPIETIYCYNILKNKYGYTGRMSNFPVLLADLFELKEFEFFDPHKWNTAEFLSYLLELQIKYQKGDMIDMAQLHKDILEVYQFTRKEKRMFIEESIEKRLWSIFIFLNNPNKELLINR